jgi:predicted small lipoprotein YifL
MKNTQSMHGNKITCSAFAKTTISLIFAFALSACGQRGALFIPTVPEAAQRSTILNTIATPAEADTQKK